MLYEIVNENNPFFGKVFEGHRVTMSGESRIWNDESEGQSFPENDCECVHPSYLRENRFPFPVIIFHSFTGHIYIKPKSNLNPFTEEEEKAIQDILFYVRLKGVKTRVLPNYTTVSIGNGQGFRIVNMSIDEFLKELV